MKRKGLLRYEQVGERIRSGIRAGGLRPGSRLPSVRKLSQQAGVSVSTVLQAYLQLENEGLIETRPQSGHYVRLQKKQLPEPTVERAPRGATLVTISSLVASVYTAARDPLIVPFGAATPAPSLLPTRKLNALLAELAKNSDKSVEYDPPPGFLPLRQQIARKSLDWGCALSPDELVTTCGASEALHLALQCVARRGDTIAIESPAYYGTLRVIEALGLKALEIPADPRDGISLEVLEKTLSRQRIAAVLVVSNFSNPLGSVIPDEGKQKLVAMLGKRDIPLIEDDPYGDLHYGPVRPMVAKSFDRKGLVLLCGSFSKTLAPGYRVGFIAPGRFQERVELLKFAQTVATAALPQMAIAEFLRAGGYDRHLRRLSRALETSVQRFSQSVAQHFPEGTRVTRPTGGGLLWVELPRGGDALALHARALEAGIGIAPGPIFSARGGFRSHFRLNCALPWTERVEHAVMRLGQLSTQVPQGKRRAVS